MGHAKHSCIGFKVARDPVPVSLGSLALQGEFKGLADVEGGKMQVIFRDVGYLTSVVLPNLLQA